MAAVPGQGINLASLMGMRVSPGNGTKCLPRIPQFPHGKTSVQEGESASGLLCYYQRRELVSAEKSVMAYVIAEPCIGTKDTACVDACPVDCIHPKKDEDGHAEADQLFIDPVECIDCGACVPACPVSAIFAQDDLPEKWAHFTEKNAAHFGR
jgi:NAD-dependent dihydropyrimidine dehydrogenase PreA subunit